MILAFAVLQGVKIQQGKARGSVAVRGAVNSILADYQPAIFERYQLFMLDKTYAGAGEGLLEYRMQEYLDYSLNSNAKKHIYSANLYDYSSKVTLLGTKGVMEDNLQDLKYQVMVCMKDEVLLQAIQTSIKKPTNKKEEGQKVYTVDSMPQETEKQDDPRIAFGESMGNGLLPLVVKDAEGISKKDMDISGLPSGSIKKQENLLGKDLQDNKEVETIWKNNFEDAEMLELAVQNSQQLGETQGIQEEDIYAIGYAMTHFRYATAKQPQYPTALQYEVEYLLCGHYNDYANLEETAQKLVYLRWGPNMVYACKNDKMRKEAGVCAKGIAAAICAEPVAPVLQYLLLGCWSYAESIMDVKVLLQGKRIPITKNEETWQLQLSKLGCIATTEGKEEPDETKGMSYAEYLYILLAMTPNKDLLFFRMLDVIQWNVRIDNPEFEIQNCITQMEISVELDMEKYHFNYYVEKSYE